jgi:hypothetical protein
MTSDRGRAERHVQQSQSLGRELLLLAVGPVVEVRRLEVTGLARAQAEADASIDGITEWSFGLAGVGVGVREQDDRELQALAAWIVMSRTRSSLSSEKLASARRAPGPLAGSASA